MKVNIIINIICILIFIYVIHFVFNKFEFFENPVEYNSDDIPENKLDSIYDKETADLTNLFNTLPTIKEIPSDYKNTFQNVSNYTILIIYNEFSKRLVDVFDNLFNIKINIVKESYNVYYKDFEDSREYIFNININNKKTNTIRILKVYLKINQIKNLLNDKGDIEQYNLIYLKNNIEINKLVLDDLLKDETEVSSSNLFSNYYKIDKKNSSKDEMLITESMKDNFKKMLKERELSEQKERIKKGNCYDEDNNIIGINKEECNAIWDYIPKTSQECPYNESNKNYPNNFGKLKDNYCELPNNMKLIGYRNFSKDPNYLPVCYNCEPNKRLFANKTVGFCCDDQKDKSLYPNLVTPDYAFKNDEELREKYEDQLSIKNLSYK
jgi:hypothetical protein